uniref:40S ribosomal protein S12 n=1 Tax=Caligus clemensi TaxID=344056 RepID=C1C384_CALCM|nr:40S ribosomal protein S12 [Caligus clemensi]
MSDHEGDDMQTDAAPAPAAPPAAVTDMKVAIQEVLKEALIHNGLSRGLHETTKALDKRQALFCVLAENCDEPMYVKLIQALCAQHQIPLIKVDSNMKLGEWAGLCKLDSDGNPRKVTRCSSVVVRDWGKGSPAVDAVKDYIESMKK